MPGKRGGRNAGIIAAKAAVLMAVWIAGFWGGRRAEAQLASFRLAPLIASGQTITGEPIVYPSGAPAKITAGIVTLAPGEETGWHRHGMPSFGYVLEGELTVEYDGSGPKVLKAGEALLETISLAHSGRNTGTGPMRILAVFMGAEGMPTSVKVAR